MELWMLGIKQGASEEQPVLVISKPSPQPTPGHLNNAGGLGITQALTNPSFLHEDHQRTGEMTRTETLGMGNEMCRPS